MPESVSTTEILETDVVVKHVKAGHVFRFPILSDGTVALHGAHMAHSPTAKHEAGRYLFDALKRGARGVEPAAHSR
jgi:hypothetical protein